MKNLAPLFIALLFVVQTFSQVGINTTEPTATLDVDGNIRVRDMNSSITNSEAEKIVGLDEDGNFVVIEVDENIILEDNKLRVVENRYRFANTETLFEEIINNLDLIILPGEPNDDKKVIRIITSLTLRSPIGDVDITGIQAGEDGQTVWLMAYTGKVRLVGESILSDPENRFLINGMVQLQQYDMIQLLYDATLQRWLVMDY